MGHKSIFSYASRVARCFRVKSTRIPATRAVLSRKEYIRVSRLRTVLSRSRIECAYPIYARCFRVKSTREVSQLRDII